MSAVTCSFSGQSDLIEEDLSGRVVAVGRYLQIEVRRLEAEHPLLGLIDLLAVFEDPDGAPRKGDLDLLEADLPSLPIHLGPPFGFQKPVSSRLSTGDEEPRILTRRHPNVLDLEPVGPDKRVASRCFGR